MKNDKEKKAFLARQNPAIERQDISHYSPKTFLVYLGSLQRMSEYLAKAQQRIFQETYSCPGSE